MKASGPLISALVHGALFAAVVFLVKSEGRLPTPIVAIFSDPPEPKAPAAAPKQAPPPRPTRAASPRAAARPAPAPAPLQAAAPAQGPKAALAGPTPLDLGLTLDAEGEGGIPAGAVVVPSSMVAGGAARPAVGGGAAGGSSTSLRKEAGCTEESTPPRPLRRVEVEYPPDAPGQAGRLEARLRVGEDGEVTGVEVVQGVGPEVDRAAVQSLRRWVFRPASRCGRAISASYVVVLNFELAD